MNQLEDAILKKIYPIISTKMNKNANKFKQCIARFVEKRSNELYDIAPCDRIYFGQEDLDDFYKSTEIEIAEVQSAIEQTYYYPMANFNPRAAKDEFTIAMMCVIRYFYLNHKEKELELSMIYLAFSGKFYPSIHSGQFPKFQPSEYRYIMESVEFKDSFHQVLNEYVVNNSLSNRFDLKREGTVFGAIKSICITWKDSYKNRLKSFDDEDIVYLIQQLHNRIKSFMKNIAEIYYDIYQKKDRYFTYDGDSLDQDDYHIADSDSLKIERIVEKTLNYINNTSVDYKICKMASDTNVKTDEVKSIIESILNDRDNISEVRELLRIIVTEFYASNANTDVTDIKFITVSITPKPNTKNPNLIRQKEIVESWLDENSPAYRKRKSREATKSSYHKSVLTYFVLMIHNANK